MHLDPATLSMAERYNLLTGVIIPRPIAFVSTQSPDGHTNLAPYSFFNGAGPTPMALMFCPSTRDDGTDKDTLRNLLPPAEGGLGEFVVNVCGVEHVREINVASANLPPEESEFDLTGLSPAPSVRVRPPRVAEAPVSFECRTLHVLRLAPGVPSSGVVVVGEVVHITVDDALVGPRMHIDSERLAPLARLSGGEYTRVTERFTVPRGVAALQAELPFSLPQR